MKTTNKTTDKSIDKTTLNLANNLKLAKPGSLHLSVQDLAPASDEEKQQLFIMRESLTYWQDAMRRFKRNKISMIALGVIVVMFIFAFLGPFFVPYTYDQQIRGEEHLSPCFSHPFGTDALGRDMMVRNMIGARISLTIGMFCALLVVVIGTLYGAFSGYKGGTLDNIMMRILEILYSVPDVMVVILLQIALKAPLNTMFPKSSIGPSLISIFVAFALLYWVNMARMVRGQILVLKEMEYVTVARAMGSSGWHIIRKHLIPNCMGVILVTAMFQIPLAIFVESFLSFIGLGVSAPMASLGSLCSEALSGITSYPYLLFFPSILISIIILAFNMFGDGLRDALDPRLRNG